MTIAKFLATAATAVVLVLGLAPAATADPATTPEPGDTDIQIIGGGNATNAPWAARMFYRGRGWCTATIIAPRHILTAKHCVGAVPSDYSFRIGSLDAESGGTMANAAAVTKHPSADLAIFLLDRSVTATYSPLGRVGDVAVGQTVQVYGWGATCYPNESDCQSRYLKYATMRVTELPCAYGTAPGIKVCAESINGVPAGGDSGGPMFANGRQVGVGSASDRETFAAYIHLPDYRDWIASIAGV